MVQKTMRSLPLLNRRGFLLSALPRMTIFLFPARARDVILLPIEVSMHLKLTRTDYAIIFLIIVLALMIFGYYDIFPH